MKLSKITLEDIARAAGVHKMTVSRALRNHQCISPETRERIQKLARQMGYRPNPLVSIYQAHVRAGRAAQYKATIGWINDHPDRNFWHNAPWTRGLFEGAQKRARELGYVLDEIWLEGVNSQDPDANIARYSRVIHARGIHGIILPLLFVYSHAFRPWPDVAVAVVGLQHSLPPPQAPAPDTPHNLYHTASFDYFANMRLACERLRALGYRRIGLVISPWLDVHSDYQYRGAFLAEQLDWPRADHVPILFDSNNAAEPSRALGRWLERHQPDAVICSTNRARGWLERIGRRVPHDIGLAHLYLAEDVRGWSGIDPNMPDVGAGAVDLLDQQLRLNERGFPSKCHELFIAGRWVSGETTRRQSA
ncbi:MAG: LacI family transcriptional regulator [Verrucomicrobiae bacterium]|nr:LacI family transcriptional regulator [Verrucomicrobiae bacterium]